MQIAIMCIILSWKIIEKCRKLSCNVYFIPLNLPFSQVLPWIQRYGEMKFDFHNSKPLFIWNEYPIYVTEKHRRKPSSVEKNLIHAVYISPYFKSIVTNLKSIMTLSTKKENIIISDELKKYWKLSMKNVAFSLYISYFVMKYSKS